MICLPLGVDVEPRLNIPPLLPSPELGGGVPNEKPGAGDPGAGEAGVAPNVKLGAGPDGAPNEKDVVGAGTGATELPGAGCGAPNWNTPEGGALPNVKLVVGGAAAPEAEVPNEKLGLGAPNENDVVEAGPTGWPNEGVEAAGFGAGA